MLFLKQNITNKKRSLNKAIFLLKFENYSNGKKHKIEIVCSSIVYIKKSEKDHLLDFQYLIL